MSSVAVEEAETPKIAYRFSDIFNLNKRQSELDFVDILVDTDLKLYIDPYALSIEEDDWSIECNNLIVGFFQELVDTMVAKNEVKARELLDNLHEPNQTHLGESSGDPRGRGVGGKQARNFYDAFARSRAFETGILTDLSDCELFIDGISYDKISDITTNIIRRKLVDFTKEQCAKWGIPTEEKPIGVFWDQEDRSWKSGYDQLPVYRDEPIILVPKRSIRYRMAVHDQDYYNLHVVEFFRKEFLKTDCFSANRSLERVLQKPRRISKKEIAKTHPKSKEMLREFTEEHPEILMEYKKEALRNVVSGKYKLTDYELMCLIQSTAHAHKMIFLGNTNFLLQVGDNSTFTGGQQVKDINVGGDLNVGGDFVVADAISDSFIKVAGSSAPDPVKDVLRQLGDALAAFGDGLPEKQAKDISEDYDRVVQEAIKPEPKKNWLKTGLEGIRDTAAIAGVGIAGYQKVVDLIEQTRLAFGI